MNGKRTGQRWPRRKSSRRWYIGAGVIVLAAIGYAFSYAPQGKPSGPPRPTTKVAQQAKEQRLVPATPVVRSLPVRLLVSRINVDSPIEYTGVTATGNMAVPSDISKTGWYKLGPLPGNQGSAVLSGHVNGPAGQPGVFARLAELRVGDTIETVDTNGLKSAFIVKNTKRFGKDDQPDEVFHSSAGSHLNLITCVGAWDKSAHQYSDRLVVFADLAQGS